jgi:multiple sugar transport system permease protein
MVITAFKQDADLYRMDVVPLWFHLPPTLEHFTRLLTHTYFTAQLLNTLQLAACVVAITTVTAVPAGYALARLRLPGAENIGIAIFVNYLVPSIILFIPLAQGGGRAGTLRFVVGARSRLPRLHDPVLHVEDDGLLQDGAGRDRGGGMGRRL